MSNKRADGHPLFDLSFLPMDMARLVCAVLLPILRLRRITPEGEKFTKKLRGGAIIAANHTAFSDPFVVGVTFWYRRLHFLVAEVVLKGKLRGFLLKGVGAIKIDRNITDIESIKRSVEVLKKGFLLAVFPQGGIKKSDELDEIKSGAVLMALSAGVPIVPMHILPQDKWYKRRTVIIGNSINPQDYCTKKFPSTADIQNITTVLADELNRLKNANLRLFKKDINN